jgi:hypothetical protein
MRLLAESDIKIHVTKDAAVYVGAHERNGSIWWTRLPSPREPDSGRRNFEGVVVDLIDGRPVA